MFLSSYMYRNMSGSLGEQEMLWEDKPTGECFHSLFEFSQTPMTVSRTQYSRTPIEVAQNSFQELDFDGSL